MLTTLQNLIPQGAERVMLTAGGVLGGARSFAFGDVGPLLWWLVIFTVTDFFLGTGIAVLQGRWSSHKNFLGILKKALMFAIVALAHGLDEVFAPVIHFQIFQSITICAYAAGEFGSIIETLERGGLGGAVPPVLRRLVKTLNERIEAHAEEELAKRGLTVEKEKDHE